MSMPRQKTDPAAVRASWKRAVARVNASLGRKPAAASASEERPKSGWAKVVARHNAQLR